MSSYLKMTARPASPFSTALAASFRTSLKLCCTNFLTYTAHHIDQFFEQVSVTNSVCAISRFYLGDSRRQAGKGSVLRWHEYPTDSVGNNPRFVGVRYVVELFFWICMLVKTRSSLLAVSPSEISPLTRQPMQRQISRHTCSETLSAR